MNSLAWLNDRKALTKASALLARWFRWQPGEIDRLEIDEFEAYLKEASEQIKAENGT